ncbi:hypothetical protein F4859DRAFT_517283 [Xylaria cf. heliscus]|nr:hypothetical protein F4859DRAFT_517283 [Xylaria cf. heliscus]
MKNTGKFLSTALGIRLLVESSATTPNLAVIPRFPNTTGIADNPDITSHVLPCFPFEDPDCCIDYAVCECNNGTFFAINKQYGAASLCNPPSPFIYGNDISSIPGSCC